MSRNLVPAAISDEGCEKKKSHFNLVPNKMSGHIVNYVFLGVYLVFNEYGLML